ncbi:MAG: serine/threonine-protein kinase, partial [Myxococcota bacterium]
AALLAGQLIPDHGLLTTHSLTTGEAIMIMLLVQGLLAAALAGAQARRQALVRVCTAMDKAEHVAAQREALLLEARAELSRALKVGGPGRHSDQVIGSFKLGNVIGRGAMGEIYEAISKDGQTAAAVKLLHRHVADSDHHIKRFMREAEAAARLDSDHVVKLLEVGFAGKAPYMIMERLHGHDLGFYLRSRRRLSLDQVTELVRQVGAGLEAARTAGIVHRDIKPQNIFWAERRDQPRLWKILDFGVSKLADSTGTLTRGKVVGTPGYMAPEQAQGHPVDYRCDLFSLGIIVYRALTGAPPFSGKDIASVLHQVVFSMPRAPSALVELPDDIDRVLAIALAKDPADRFTSGGGLADALSAVAHSQLADDLSARADAILAKHPWDSELSRSASSPSG